MIDAVRNKLISVINKKNERSQKIFKNVVLSFGVKVLNIVIGFVLIPMTINYITPFQYGIWLTISSIVGWMNFFDVGLGHGLRNKLAYSLAINEYDEAKKYISTTYVAIGVIALVLLVLASIANPFINWNSILKVTGKGIDDLHFAVLIVIVSFCIRFVVQIINMILTAIHEPGKAAAITMFGQLGVLIAIIVLKMTLPGNLSVLVFTLTMVPILVLLIASIYLFRTKLSYIAPSVKYVDFSYLKNILHTGGYFFVIQIGAMVLFQTDNIIISRVLGPEAVTEFNVSYKLFSAILMVFNIIVTPYWSAFTDAYAKNEYEWMKKNLRFMRRLCLLLSVVCVLVLFCSKWLYKMWLGNTVQVSFLLSFAMAIYVIFVMWQTAHVFILNGLSKIKLQLILVIISSLANVPLAVYWGKRWGLAGVISANTVFFIVMGIIFSVQVDKILKQKAKGLWNS